MSRGVRPEENIDYEEDNPRFQQQKYPTRVPGFDNHQMAQDEVNDIEFLCDDGRPMQFIRYDKQTRKFTVNQEVCDVRSCYVDPSRGQRKRWILLLSWKISNRQKFFAKSATLPQRCWSRIGMTSSK
jgi:hypothetical protein